MVIIEFIQVYITTSIVGISDCIYNEEWKYIHSSCPEIQHHRLQCSSTELTCLLASTLRDWGGDHVRMIERKLMIKVESFYLVIPSVKIDMIPDVFFFADEWDCNDGSDEQRLLIITHLHHHNSK